jgi:hypothetical protein
MWVNQRFTRGRLGDRLFAIVLVVFVGTNVVRCFKIVIEQRWPAPLAAYKSGRFDSLPELARAVQAHTEPRAWILVRHKLGRILTFTSGRYAVEPDGATQLDPRIQRVYVLEPVDANEAKWETDREMLDTRTSEWMAAHEIGAGEVVATVKGKYDKQPWVLRRAVKLSPGGGAATPLPAPTQPAPSTPSADAGR